MANILWKGVAWVVSRKPVADYLIKRAMRTKYFHLPGYMDRFWLFNRYSEIGSAKMVPKRFSWLPSIRIHHILREDYARDMHSHPWNARTIILRGDYDESRLVAYYSNGASIIECYSRKRGDTATLKFNEYHNITRVPKDGVWTMFFTWEYQGGWGFLVDGVYVPHQDYDE